MPDIDVSQTQQSEQQQNAPQINPEVARMMAINLNGGIVPEEYRTQPQATETAISQGNESTAENTTTSVTETIIPPTFEILKERFQYVSPEDAIKEIEELRHLKANPTPADLKFANDEAKLFYEYLSAGEEDKLNDVLAKRRMVKDIDSKTDEQKLKLYIKLQNPLFDDELINDEYTQLYTVNEDKFKNDLDEIDTLSLRKEKLRAQQRIMNDVEKANEHFVNFKNKIELPPLPTNVDEDYNAYKKMQEDNLRIDAETKAAYPKFIPKELETKFNFNDEASKVAFDFQFEPDTDSFKQSVDYALDADKFFKVFQNSDGSPNREKWLKFIYNGFNAEKMVTEGIKQGSNARMKSLVPDNSGGIVKQMPVVSMQQESELDANMRRAGIQKGG